MKCPNCSKKPLSFMQFIMTSIPSNIHCASCDTELKPNNVIKGMIVTWYILGGILGLVIVVLAMRNEWNLFTTALVFLIAILVVAIPLDLIGWRFGRYYLAHSK